MKTPFARPTSLKIALLPNRANVFILDFERRRYGCLSCGHREINATTAGVPCRRSLLIDYPFRCQRSLPSHLFHRPLKKVRRGQDL
jgi:hypothetical protein